MRQEDTDGRPAVRCGVRRSRSVPSPPRQARAVAVIRRVRCHEGATQHVDWKGAAVESGSKWQGSSARRGQHDHAGQRLKQAASLVRTGQSASLAHAIDTAMQQASDLSGSRMFARWGFSPERQVTRDQSTIDTVRWRWCVHPPRRPSVHLASEGWFYNDTPDQTGYRCRLREDGD